MIFIPTISMHTRYRWRLPRLEGIQGRVTGSGAESISIMRLQRFLTKHFEIAIDQRPLLCLDRNVQRDRPTLK